MTHATTHVKAYHATLQGLSGILTRPGHEVLFTTMDGDTTVLTPALALEVVVLGAVAESTAQWISDMMAGGPARIATTRRQEVA